MTVSILLLLILSVAILMTAVLLIIAIRKNFHVGQSFRVQLMEKIESIRFGRMLIKHNVNLQQFLHDRPTSNIESQIRNCYVCDKTSACDSVLDKSVFSDKELDFCPNHSSIKK